MAKGNGTTVPTTLVSLRASKKCNMYAPVYVDLCRVDVEDLLGCTDDDRESLVNLPQGNVLNLEARLLERLGDGDGGRGREVNGLSAGVSVGCSKDP